jgi:DNA mismatch repair protein MutH
VAANDVAAPKSETELLERARALSGMTLGELSNRRGVVVPPELRRAKGWAGALLERQLGATSASRAEPDFADLGIELKSLPVDRSGHPVESTFVCSIPLTEIGEVEWESSWVRRKLARVLWVPIEGERAIPPSERRIGEPLLWSPSPNEERDLRFDWEELVGLIGLGDVEAVTGHRGRYLQVRPKAAHGRVRRLGVDRAGARLLALPRGFYLRTVFTAHLLAQHYRLPDSPRG